MKTNICFAAFSLFLVPTVGRADLWIYPVILDSNSSFSDNGTVQGSGVGDIAATAPFSTTLGRGTSDLTFALVAQITGGSTPSVTSVAGSLLGCTGGTVDSFSNFSFTPSPAFTMGQGASTGSLDSRTFLNGYPPKSFYMKSLGSAQAQIDTSVSNLIHLNASQPVLGSSVVLGTGHFTATSTINSMGFQLASAAGSSPGTTWNGGSAEQVGQNGSIADWGAAFIPGGASTGPTGARLTLIGKSVPTSISIAAADYDHVTSLQSNSAGSGRNDVFAIDGVKFETAVANASIFVQVQGSADGISQWASRINATVFQPPANSELSGYNVVVPLSRAIEGYTVAGFNFDCESNVDGVTFGNFGVCGGSVWQPASGNHWDDSNSWLGYVPNQAGRSAIVGSGSSDAVLDVASVERLGSISIGSPFTFTFNGTGAFAFQTIQGDAAVSVRGGAHTIFNLPVSVAQALDCTILNTGSRLTVTGVLSGPAGITLNGDGTLALSGNSANTYAGSTTVASGNLVIAKLGALGSGNLSTSGKVFFNPDLGGATRFNQLTISTSGSVDIANNDLILTNEPITAASQLVRQGRNGGAWNGNGITTSLAQTDQLRISAIGLVSGAEYRSLGSNSFGGSSFTNTDALLRYTYTGDADLNGKINSADYHQLDAGYQMQHNTGFVFDWFNGDFDYNGVINSQDYALIDQAYQLQTGTLNAAVDFLETGAMPSGPIGDSLAMVIDHENEFGRAYADAFILNAVPEPTAIGLLGVASAAALSRRKRRHGICLVGSELESHS